MGKGQIPSKTEAIYFASRSDLRRWKSQNTAYKDTAATERYSNVDNGLIDFCEEFVYLGSKITLI